MSSLVLHWPLLLSQHTLFPVHYQVVRLGTVTSGDGRGSGWSDGYGYGYDPDSYFYDGIFENGDGGCIR